MAIDPETSSIYSAGADGYVIQWNWPVDTNGELVAQVPEAIYSIYLYNGSIYCGLSTGDVYCISEEQRKVIASAKLHSMGTFAFAGREGELFTGGGDGILLKCDPELNVISKRELLPPRTSIRQLYFRGDVLFAACSDNRVHVIEPNDLKTVGVIEGHTNSVFDLAFSEEDVFSTGRDATIRKWKAFGNSEDTQSVNAHLYAVQTLALSPDGKLLLSGSMDKSIRIWSAELELLKVVNNEKQDGHTNAVNKVLWIDANHFISCGDDRAIMLFHVRSD